MNYLHFIGELAIQLEKSDPIYLEGGKIIRVSTPWRLIKNKVLRFLCHFHLSSNINSKFPLPFRRIWNRKLFKNRFKDNIEPVCIIFGSHFYEMMNTGAIKYIKRHYPNSYIILSFSDKYEYFKKHYKSFPKPETLKQVFDVVCTYNECDAQQFGFYLQRASMKDYSFVVEDESIPCSDLFFVGQDKGRLDILHELYRKCTDAKLVCDFYISGVADEKKKYPNEIKYNQIIDYREALKRAKRSKCIVNIVQEGANGITMRDYEAFGFNKFLLTNNDYIKGTDFYSREQVIMLDEIEQRFNEIRNGYHGVNAALTDFSKKRFYEDIANKIAVDFNER